MNDSGRSVSAAARFFKVEPDAILVVHDEGDLDLGRLQARQGRRPRAVTTASARSRSTSARRTSSGCGSASAGPDAATARSLADYVLSDFEPHDDAEAIVARAADAVETLDAEGLERAQARFN